MTKKNKQEIEKNEKNAVERFLDKLPSKVPFVPGVRRPRYQLRRVKGRFNRKLATTIIIALMFMGTFYVLVGGFYYSAQDENYAIVEHPITREPTPIWMYDLHEQTIFEGTAVGILAFIGAGGFYLIHQSSHYAYSPVTAAKYMIAGIFIALFAILAVTTIFVYKIGWLEEWIKNARAVITA